jgi:transposase
MPRPYPREFREAVIRVARSRGPGVRLKDIAEDFGISESCLKSWLVGVSSGTLPHEVA